MTASNSSPSPTCPPEAAWSTPQPRSAGSLARPVPRGTGFLCVSERLIGQLEPPFLDLHAATWTAPERYQIRADARRFETWETNYLAKIGLGVAVDYALQWGMEAVEERVTALARRLRRRLAELPHVTVQDHGRRLCGIVTFTVDGVPSADVLSLDPR